MPPVIIVGVNSWLTIAQADAYFEAKYGAAAWATLSLLVRTQLLITACRWLRQQASLSIALSDTSQVVKDAQCEAAWFLYSYQASYEKRRALYSSGVKSFRVLDWSESLGEVTFPPFLSDMLTDYVVSLNSQFPRMSRDLEDNAAE